MSRWDDLAWYKARPRPPPQDGIKMKATGTTWWGQRWIEALAGVLRGDVRRLARGRTYARAGRIHDLVVSGGVVTAKVTGSRAAPYRVTIEVAQLPASVWARVIVGMAKQAQFAAELLAGQMPKHIAEVFRDAGTNLFPAHREDLVTRCTCPDWSDPCKHVAATHYVLGEALDRDPFLLFELRGYTKAQVLDALRLVRSGGLETKPARGQRANTTAAGIEIPKVTLDKVDPAAYDRPREDLPALQLSFNEPATPGAILRQLGTPAAWSSSGSPEELLAPLVRAAAARARSIAMAEPEGPEEVEEPERPEEPDEPEEPKEDVAAGAVVEAPVRRSAKRRRPPRPAPRPATTQAPASARAPTPVTPLSSKGAKRPSVAQRGPKQAR